MTKENKQQLSALEKIDEILLRCDELQREHGLEIWFLLKDEEKPKQIPGSYKIYGALPKTLAIHDEIGHLKQLTEAKNY